MSEGWSAPRRSGPLHHRRGCAVTASFAGGEVSMPTPFVGSMRFVLLAPSYLGKSTAHKLGLALDPEETLDYADVKRGWGDPSKANDPAWRAQAARAYDAARQQALLSEASFVVVHPPHVDPSSPILPNPDWDLGDRALVALLPSRSAFGHAVQEYRAEVASGAAHAPSRLNAFIRGTEACLVLVTEGVPGMVTDSVSEAITTLVGPFNSAARKADPSLLHPAPERLERLAIALRSLARAVPPAPQEASK